MFDECTIFCRKYDTFEKTWKIQNTLLFLYFWHNPQKLFFSLFFMLRQKKTIFIIMPLTEFSFLNCCFWVKNTWIFYYNGFWRVNSLETNTVEDWILRWIYHLQYHDDGMIFLDDFWCFCLKKVKFYRCDLFQMFKMEWYVFGWMF